LKTIKDYEYFLNEKQSTLDNYVQYLDIVCEIAKIDKIQVIEIVQNTKKNMINKLNFSSRKTEHFKLK
jgi:L-rhamnose mutarotase